MNGCKKKTSYVKRLTAVLIVLLLMVQLFSLSPAAATGGSCGENLEWSYAAGTLTITGRGDMTVFTEGDMPPWYAFADQIMRLVLPEQLTSVGNLAFYGCKNLQTVVLPDSVRKVGNMAFMGCERLSVVSLGKTLRTIGYDAFNGCKALGSIRLPYGLEEIGYRAFYRCEALTTVTVPADVKNMGVSVFAYCKNLVRAEIKARLTAVPEWTFYGCESLKDVILAETVSDAENYAFLNCEELAMVYFGGSAQKAETLLQGIAESVPEFPATGSITNATPPAMVYSGKTIEHDNGTVTQSNTIIREEEHIKVVTVVDRTHSVSTVTPDGEIVPPVENKDSYTTNLVVTVEDKEGWDSVHGAVQSALKEVNNTYSELSQNENTKLTVQIKDGGFEGEALMQELAGKDISVTVVTSNGSGWRFDCENLKKDELPENYDFSYTVGEASAESCEKLGTDVCYQVKFEGSAEMKAEVLVPLPSAAYTNAYLYQVEQDGSHTLLQGVAVDQNSNAHFYVASVDADTQYVVGVDVPGERTDNVIVPDELLAQYGSTVERVAEVEYVITGVKSSWGLSFMQVTWIMLGVLGGCIVVVGVVMVVWNKQKMKKLRGGAQA